MCYYWDCGAPGSEDLVQTALAKVCPHWERLNVNGDPDAYVRRAVVTSFLTWRSRRWHGERPAAELPERSAEGDSFDAVDLRDALARVLPALPAHQRAVLVLRFYEDLSVQQTADALGCSTGTIKSQTKRAIARLQSMDVMRGTPQ